jgi:hypothetical protein
MFRTSADGTDTLASRMKVRNRFGALAAVLACALGTPPVRADVPAPQKASAEALFDEAIRLMKAGNFAEACPKLETSQRLDPGVGTLLYLGECYEKVGRAASSWATFREAASAAEAAGQSKRVQIARERAARVEAALAYLTVEVDPGTRALPGLVLRRDGIDAGLSIAGAPVPVDPGSITIEATAPGYEPFSLTVVVEASGRQSVLVPPLVKSAPPPAPGAIAPLAAPPPAPAPAEARAATAANAGDPGATQRWVGLSLSGLGLVGVGLGAYFGLRAIDEDSQADEGSCDASLCQEASDLEHAESANRAAIAANVAFGVGGGLIAVGLAVFFSAPSAPREAALRVAPRLGPGFAGLGVEGRL